VGLINDSRGEMEGIREDDMLGSALDQATSLTKVGGKRKKKSPSEPRGLVGGRRAFALFGGGGKEKI